MLRGTSISQIKYKYNRSSLVHITEVPLNFRNSGASAVNRVDTPRLGHCTDIITNAMTRSYKVLIHNNEGNNIHAVYQVLIKSLDNSKIQYICQSSVKSTL